LNNSTSKTQAYGKPNLVPALLLIWSIWVIWLNREWLRMIKRAA
jgi:hypothetical protein